MLCIKPDKLVKILIQGKVMLFYACMKTAYFSQGLQNSLPISFLYATHIMNFLLFLITIPFSLKSTAHFSVHRLALQLPTNDIHTSC